MNIMTTRLATQRNFLITTQENVATVTNPNVQTVTATTQPVQQNTPTEVTIQNAHTAATISNILNDNNSTQQQNIHIDASGSIVTTTINTNDIDEQYKFIEEDEDDAISTATNLDDVILPSKIIENNVDVECGSVGGSGEDGNGVAVISVVPLETSDSSNDTQTINMPDLSSIKDNVELAQQIANGQVTVVQGPGVHGDEGTPHFITVTVSAQDAGQNYQVQYVDTELYHSNSSQTQMAYPFCPVADYQTNGQAYYTPATATGNYTSTAAAVAAAAAAASSSSSSASVALTNTIHTSHATSTLPYLVPVDESLLLNSSSQSHSRDSPHSLTEVTYIQEPQSTPQTPTSTTNSLSGGSMGNGGGGASSENEQSPLGGGGNTNKIASATIKWLSRNYETADGVSLPRSTLYNHYIQHCNENKLEPVNAASFGKLIRSVFSGLRTRRLGTRGNSKYHYYGIRIKPDSILNHVMNDKPHVSYSTRHNINSTNSSHHNNNNGSMNDANISGVSSSGAAMSMSHIGGHGSSSGGSAMNRVPKKLIFKPEAYEACAQFLGDGTGVIPPLPHIVLDQTFSSELTQDDVDNFCSLYREQCESFLEAVLNLEFSTIEYLWRDFWHTNDNNNLDECDEEKYLSKTKLYLLCHCTEIQKFVREVDYQFYQNMVDVIIPDVLRSIPNALTQAIRNFAKNLEIWLSESMLGVPERLVQIKTSTISAFCQTLRRYTSLNHLAQAARAVLLNSTQIQQMLSDLNRVDFHNVQEQAAWVCQCEPSLVQRLENDFKAALQQQSSLEQWASWLQLVVDSALQEYQGKPSYPKAARQFLLKWSFYSSMVIRDLTLRSASSFGSFHLIRLLYDEYMFYLVEHKIAEAQQKTAIAVICERMQKETDFDFDCQFEFIQNESNEQNIQTQAAKRLKQE